MFKASQRPLKNKRDPQQFLQHGIGGNFKMILVNESNEPFVPVAANLPSGFKPLSSSTPKRSRKSFEIIEKPMTSTRLQPAPRLTMSQFIGETPNPSVQNQNTTSSSSSNTKNINFDKSTSKSFETPIIVANDTSSVHVKRQRSTSCQSWDSFQKQLRPILKTTAKDLDNTEKILKLILQFNSHSNKNKCNRHYQEENFNIFEFYIKIRALMKASETFDDWNKCQEKFLNSTDNEEGSIEKNNRCMSASQNAGSFKVPEVPLYSKPAVKPMSNDSEIIIADDIPPTMVNRSSQTSITSYFNKTSADILDSTLKFNSSSKNNNRQKNQPDKVFKKFENFVDSKISTTTVSETTNEFNFFKEVFPDSFKTEEVFDKNNQLMTSSKNFASFQVPEPPATLFLKPTKPIKSYFKTKRISNQKIVDSPYFNFNKAFEQTQTNSHRSYGARGKTSQFKEELQKLLQTNNRRGIQQKKVSKAPLYNKHTARPVPKDFEINISNDIRPIANGKPQLRTSCSNTTQDLLEWIFQYNSSLKNNTNQMSRPNVFFESFVDANISTMVSKTMDDLSIFHDYIHSEEDDELLFSKTKFGLFTKNNFNLN